MDDSDSEFQSELETELESLQAIFIDELTFSRKEDGSVDEIELLLHPSTGHDTSKQFVCMRLVFRPPTQYPHEAPELEIRNPRGLGEEEIESLAQDMKVKATEYLGEPMLYTLIEMARDSLTEGNVPRCPCVVCLEHFEPTDAFQRTGCYHYFHTRCLHMYLVHTRAAMAEERRTREEEGAKHVREQEKEEVIVCPLCREPLDAESLSVVCESNETVEEETFVPSSELRDQQRRMAEVYQRQKAKGGIIDLEAERNKYLVNPDTVVTIPTSSTLTADAPASRQKSPRNERNNSHGVGEKATSRQTDRNRKHEGLGEGHRRAEPHSAGGRGRGRGGQGRNSEGDGDRSSGKTRGRGRGNQEEFRKNRSQGERGVARGGGESRGQHRDGEDEREVERKMEDGRKNERKVEERRKNERKEGEGEETFSRGHNTAADEGRRAGGNSRARSRGEVETMQDFGEDRPRQDGYRDGGGRGQGRVRGRRGRGGHSSRGGGGSEVTDGERGDVVSVRVGDGSRRVNEGEGVERDGQRRGEGSRSGQGRGAGGGQRYGEKDGRSADVTKTDGSLGGRELGDGVRMAGGFGRDGRGRGGKSSNSEAAASSARGGSVLSGSDSSAGERDGDRSVSSQGDEGRPISSRGDGTRSRGGARGSDRWGYERGGQGKGWGGRGGRWDNDRDEHHGGRSHKGGEGQERSRGQQQQWQNRDGAQSGRRSNNNNSSNSNNNMGPGGPNNMRPRMMGNGGVPPNSMGMGPGGMNQGMGPNNMGQGMGPMNQNMGPGNMNQGMGPGNVNQGLGAGGLNQNMGPGGPNQNMGPGGMNQNMGPGNMNRNMGPGGMNQNMAPGGMNQGMGPAGMNQNVGPGGMNQNMVPGSTILPPSEPGSATATSTNNSMGGPRPPPVSAGQEVGFMDMDYRIKPDFDGDGRVEQRMNTGETNEMGDTDHRVKEKEVTEEDEDDEENSKDLKELDKIRQQIQAQIDNASDGEEEEEEEGENEDEEMAEDGSVLPKKEELSPERMDESGQEIKDEKAAIKAEVEAEMANIEVPAHLPKKQRELFIRIQQQQLMREKEKEKQEAAKAAEDSEVKEEAADDWYSSDEEGDNQKAPNLTDVLKKLSKDTLPVSSSEGSVVKQEVPDTSSASAAPATTSTGSMFNIMQMINAIKKQSSTSSAKLPTETITSTQAPGSPKSPTDSEGKPFQLPSALLQQLPALTVDPPVVSARPLNPLKYAVVKIALNMPKPYTQLPKGVNASDPSYKSDPRVKWYLQYLEKQLQSAPKEVVRRPSVDTEKPSKPVDPRLKKVPTDPRLAKAAADSGSGDVSRPTDPRLQRAQAQGRPTDPRLARQAGANLDPRLNRQNSQDPMGNMGMMSGQMSSPMAGSGGVMNTGGMGMGGPMNNMNSMGNMMGGMPNSMAGGMNSGMNNMGRPMNNQMGGPMNNPMGGPGMMGGPGPMNNPMGGPGPMNNQRGSPAMNNQMGGPAMNNPMGGGSMNNMMGGGPMNVMKSRMNNPMRPFQGGPVNAPMGGPMGNNMNRMGNPMNPMGGPMNAMGGPIGGNQNMNRMGGPQGPGGGMGGPGPVGPQGIMGSDSGDRRMAGDFHNPSDPRLGGGQRPPNDPRVKIKASEPNKNDPRTNRRDPRMGPVSMDESDSDIRMLSSDPSSGSKSNNLQRPGGSFSNSSKDFSQSGNFPPPPLPDPMMDLPIGDADLRLGLGTPPTSSSSSTPPPDSMQDFDSDLPKPAQKFDHRNDPRFKRVKRSTSQLKNSVEYNSPLGSAEEVMVSEEGDGSQFSNYNKPRFPPGKDPRSRNVPSPSLPDTLHDFEAQGPPPPMEAEPALKVKDLFKTIDPTASPFC
ncbi:ribosome-binding protein 1 [Aplysia californica]|uniref:Ribosome-binding protein 1 n=1 Tax=Aplysia californica TaxID=6500 RepID=A0ABM1ABD8_APLCA|nr:ribosome-binding protein 1 [Aplysia californica]